MERGEINLCAIIYAKKMYVIINKKCIQKHYNMNGTYFNLRNIDVRYIDRNLYLLDEK